MVTHWPRSAHVALHQTRLVPGWVTVCGRVNYLCNQTIRSTQDFHPYGVDKSSTKLLSWGEGGAVTSVGWFIIITLCDPIDKWRPVVLR